MKNVDLNDIARAFIAHIITRIELQLELFRRRGNTLSNHQRQSDFSKQAQY